MSRSAAALGARRVALPVLLAVSMIGTAGAQGPDLVQVTFNRAFGRAPLLASGGQWVSSGVIDSAIASGRAAAANPGDPTRGEAFVARLDAVMSSMPEGTSLSLLTAILAEALEELTEDRAYLHARLAEVNGTAEILLEQATELTHASQRLAMPGQNRGNPTTPVTVVRIDMRLFANDDAENRRTQSCAPCFTTRMVRLRAQEIERELAEAATVQARVLARREELLGRGAEFNLRAQAVVRRFAEALQTLDQRRGGAIQTALK